jgi:curved DNA-binding protein CbpA
VLRAFGVELEGTGPGQKPTAGQLRKAYRQAMLRFHPDRQGKASVRERVEAEEKFKIISRKMDEW